MQVNAGKPTSSYREEEMKKAVTGNLMCCVQTLMMSHVNHNNLNFRHFGSHSYYWVMFLTSEVSAVPLTQPFNSVFTRTQRGRTRKGRGCERRLLVSATRCHTDESPLRRYLPESHFVWGQPEPPAGWRLRSSDKEKETKHHTYPCGPPWRKSFVD